MRVCIDARYLHADEAGVRPAGGIGRYTLHLINGLLERAPRIELTLLVPSTNRGHVVASQHRHRVREVPMSGRANSWRTILVAGARIGALRDLGLYHSPFNLLPRGLGIPSIVTLHDLMWVEQPTLCSRHPLDLMTVGPMYRYGIRSALRQASHVIAISHTTREAVMRVEPRAGSRTTVITHGVDDSFHPMPEDVVQRVLRRLLPAGSRFVLMVGQGSPYKNHAYGIEAFLRAFADEPRVKLVVVRRFSRLDPAMLRVRIGRAVRERVLLLPSVREDELRALYCGARMFLFPSLCEGFGMPILEAMACGVPVVTSDRGSMREIADGAAMLVDPSSVDSIAGGLRRVHHDERLRADLRRRGLLRAATFSWHDCVRKTLDVYEAQLGTALGHGDIRMRSPG